MPRRDLQELGSLQRQVLEALWSSGGATVHEVIAALARDKRPAYTTVLSVLQTLEKQGWVRHTLRGRTYVYRARSSRDEAGRSGLKGAIDKLFGGDRLIAFRHLLGDRELGEEELETLRGMIAERERELERDH
jgi:predicted transcriptional regulator